MNVQCIDSDSAFAALRDEWEALRLRSSEPSYFLSYDWIRCCWQEVKADHRLRVFVVRNGGVPVLIAPCMLRRSSENSFPAASLTLIEHPESQIAGMLWDENDGGRGLAALLRYLLTERSQEWTILQLDKIPEPSRTARFLTDCRAENTGALEAEGSHQSLVLSLDRTWEEYLAGQSQRFRKTLRNVANRMRKLGRLEVKTYQGPCAEEALEKIFSVSQSSWKVADGVAITSSTKRMQFFRDLAAERGTAEGLRIIILEVDGRPTASEIQAVDGQTIYALRSDYDEQYADSSPGTFLQMEILQELFASAYAEYNFGVGVNPYKTRWTEDHRPLLCYRLYNRTLYGKFLRTVRRCEPRLAKIPGVFRFSRRIAGK